MQVFLDDQPFQVPRPTLAAALKAAADHAEAKGRIIVEAKADGAPLSDADLTNPADTPARYSTLHFVTADPRQLVRVTLLDAADALDMVRAEQQAVAEHLQTGRLDEGLRQLQTVITTWSAVRDVLDRSAALLNLDLAQLHTSDANPDTSINEASTSLARTLAEVKVALENQDWAALSDMVGYDLESHSATWKSLLTTLADRIAKL